jgi:glyoxylase I family protein
MDAPPFMLAGLDHIVLRVCDRARMLVFYCDVLGCVLEREQSELGLTQLRAGRSLIDLVTLSGPLGAGTAPGTAGGNVDHFCLTLGPYEESTLLGWFRTHGVSAGEPGMRYGAEGDGPSIFVRDPEGNRIELKAALA